MGVKETQAVVVYYPSDYADKKTRGTLVYNLNLTTDQDFTGSADVYRFDLIYDFSSPTLDPDDVSDYYPVWAEFYVSGDSD